jgi:hypothetical protein
MGVTILAAVQVEEEQLRQAFGSTYDDYAASRAEPMRRRFSVERAFAIASTARSRGFSSDSPCLRSGFSRSYNELFVWA